MTNQIIEVPDIAVVKTVDGAKKLLSLRDQKIKKDKNLHNFGAGSGVKYQGDLYVLDSGIIPIVRMTTSKIDPSFTVKKNSDIEVDWGDGIREKNVFTHMYTDSVSEHEVIFYGKENALTELYCANNKLTSLRLDGNLALIILGCGNNKLTTLDVSKNTFLEVLDCRTNQLTTLDLTRNTELESLSCFENQFVTLDVSKNTKLKSFSISFNKLTSLDVCKNTRLAVLYCSGNQLNTLDVSKNIHLTELYCSENQLTTLDISMNTAIVKLLCYSNPFIVNESALTFLANSLPQRKSGSSGELRIWNDSSAIWIQAICNEKNWIIT